MSGTGQKHICRSLSAAGSCNGGFAKLRRLQAIDDQVGIRSCLCTIPAGAPGFGPPGISPEPSFMILRFVFHARSNAWGERSLRLSVQIPASFRSPDDCQAAPHGVCSSSVSPEGSCA